MTVNKLLFFVLLSFNVSVASDPKQQTSEGLVSTKLTAKSLPIDDFVLNYEKRKLQQNRAIRFYDIKIFFKKELPNGWIGYLFDLDITHKEKRFIAKDMLFTNGTEVVNQLQSLDGVDYKRFMHPTLDERYYDNKYLIAGNINSKHKLVIFSEPLCPACVNVLPKYIKEVSTNPSILALFYIPMPLSMHHTARDLVKASILAKEEGIKNVSLKLYQATSKIYQTNPLQPFDPYQEKDSKKALDLFNQAVGTNITLEDISKEYLEDEVKKSLKLADEAMVNGTPTIFFDGEVDIFRNKHKPLIK